MDLGQQKKHVMGTNVNRPHMCDSSPTKDVRPLTRARNERFGRNLRHMQNVAGELERDLTAVERRAMSSIHIHLALNEFNEKVLRDSKGLTDRCS